MNQSLPKKSLQEEHRRSTSQDASLIRIITLKEKSTQMLLIDLCYLVISDSQLMGCHLWIGQARTAVGGIGPGQRVRKDRSNMNKIPQLGVLLVQWRGQQSFSLKIYLLNVLRFVGHMVCIANKKLFLSQCGSSHRQHNNA